MKSLWIAGTVAWFAIVGLGAGAIFAHATTPGAQGAAPLQWPAESSLAEPATGFTLVMFVHPECPCSRASLAELAEIANSAPRAAIQIVYSHTDGGDSWGLGGRVAGATRVLEPLGLEAARFGARTSGHVVVYDDHGRLRYAGGITGSRGHRGDNIGRRTVERLLARDGTDKLGHPVFGCAL